MIKYEDMPEDNADIAKIEIDFPRLANNTAESCPSPMREITEYLHREAETVTADELEFIRTAQVEEHCYWIWRFPDEGGDECYVTVWTRPDGTECIGYDFNHYGLTPEQFILGDYHEVY